VFRFTGQKSTPAKSSYVLLFDPASQKATLEPLASSYTFNLLTKNGVDVASTYPPIYHKKPKPSSQDAVEEALFDGDNENEDPDADNPYDFRHFLGAVTAKGNDSEYNSNSPDYRTGTGSAVNTPVMPASRKPQPSAASSAAVKPKQKSKINVQPPKARKRKSPDPDIMVSRKNTTAKASQATPTVRLDRRASTKAEPTKEEKKQEAKRATATKIKSAEIVHSSDDSDLDAEGSPASPSPPPQRYLDDESDSDSDDGGGGGGLEIEVPDARPGKPRNALASLGLGQGLGLGGAGLRHLSPDPIRGPISLASAANSVEGTPNRFTHDADDGETFDFGNIAEDSDEDAEAEDDDEEDERPRRERDGDVEPMDIGPPVTSMSSRKMSVGGMAIEEDEDDPLYKEMMEGLVGGDSSEESEEE
jgi:hypothetical protein